MVHRGEVGISDQIEIRSGQSGSAIILLDREEWLPSRDHHRTDSSGGDGNEVASRLHDWEGYNNNWAVGSGS